ncbi:DUF2141 domain-containing protein [Thalassotalea euphylliae]|uniref:DUF2141 domain-containing protein n=1 Tax=Thalassotalea euphylliae TaxID=1655234 RepID=UPI003631A12A
MSITKPSLITLLTAITFAGHANAKQIDFHIQGIQVSQDNSVNGKIYIQLFKGEDGYKNNKPEAATIVAPKESEAIVSFNNLEAGEYAIRFFHDQNDNGELETNLFGLPTEGYGFSNNARPNFGPVIYEQIKFTLDESQTSVTNQTNVIY